MSLLQVSNSANISGGTGDVKDLPDISFVSFNFPTFDGALDRHAPSSVFLPGTLTLTTS